MDTVSILIDWFNYLARSINAYIRNSSHFILFPLLNILMEFPKLSKNYFSIFYLYSIYSEISYTALVSVC